MGNELPTGFGEKGPIERRSADIERFLSRLSRRRIFADDEFGDTRQFEILAHVGPKKGEILGTSGAFFGLYKDKGDTYLQGGMVSGVTSGSENVRIKPIKVIDKKTGVGTLKEKILWIKITVDFIVADGVLVPGLKVTAAECSATTTSGATVPANQAATADSYKGIQVYLAIGEWSKTTFLTSQSAGKNIVMRSCGLGQIEED